VVPTTDQDRAHEALGEQECLRLLGTTGIGRIAYTEAALPAILPVSYALRDGDVLIPTQPGSALAHAVRGAVVAFETDSYDDAARTGWSVIVVGASRVLRAGRPEDPDGWLIAVQVSLVRGWRTTTAIRAAGTAGPESGTYSDNDRSARRPAPW
jgi:hypothetical protein